MKLSSRIKLTAAISSAALIVSACSDNTSSPSNDNGSDVDGLPAQDMQSWDVDCDWFHIDELQEFLGFDEWGTGPMAVGHGAGTNPSGLTCEASFLWPEFETPLGHTRQADATFGYDVFPTDNQADAEELFEQHVEHIQDFYPDEEAIVSGSIDGSWQQSHYFVSEYGTGDYYFFVFQDEDFVMDFTTVIPDDPTERYDDDELLPGEWAGFEFDQESATEFFFEEQMPKIHNQFLTLLERNE